VHAASKWFADTVQSTIEAALPPTLEDDLHTKEQSLGEGNDARAVNMYVDRLSLVVRLPDNGMGIFVKINPDALPAEFQMAAQEYLGLLSERVVLVHVSHVRRLRQSFPMCCGRVAHYQVVFDVSFFAWAVKTVLSAANLPDASMAKLHNKTLELLTPVDFHEAMSALAVRYDAILQQVVESQEAARDHAYKRKLEAWIASGEAPLQVVRDAAEAAQAEKVAMAKLCQEALLVGAKGSKRLLLGWRNALPAMTGAELMASKLAWGVNNVLLFFLFVIIWMYYISQGDGNIDFGGIFMTMALSHVVTPILEWAEQQVGVLNNFKSLFTSPHKKFLERMKEQLKEMPTTLGVPGGALAGIAGKSLNSIAGIVKDAAKDKYNEAMEAVDSSAVDGLVEVFGAGVLYGASTEYKKYRARRQRERLVTSFSNGASRPGIFKTVHNISSLNDFFFEDEHLPPAPAAAASGGQRSSLSAPVQPDIDFVAEVSARLVPAPAPAEDLSPGWEHTLEAAHIAVKAEKMPVTVMQAHARTMLCRKAYLRAKSSLEEVLTPGRMQPTEAVPPLGTSHPVAPLYNTRPFRPSMGEIEQGSVRNLATAIESTPPSPPPSAPSSGGAVGSQQDWLRQRVDSAEQADKHRS